MTPGIYQISMAEYLTLPYLSASLSNTILQYSPCHAKYEQENRADDASSDADMGTAIHDVLLEGRDRIVVIDAPDWRTKAAKEQREFARADGNIPMLAHKVEQIERAVEAARAFIAGSEIAGAFDIGKPEQTIIWQEGKLTCKARPDWLNDRLLLHVKTTKGSAEPNAWIRNQLVPMGYDVAMAFYARGIMGPNLMGFTPHVQSVFLVIEQNQPYGCSLVGLDPAMWDLALRKVDRAIRIWQECQATGKYPGYPSRICYAEPRPWELAEAEERDANDVYDQLQEREGLQP